MKLKNILDELVLPVISPRRYISGRKAKERGKLTFLLNVINVVRAAQTNVTESSAAVTIFSYTAR